MKLYVTFFTVLTHFLLWSQKHCGTDEIHQQLFNEHPSYDPGILRAHERLQNDTKAFLTGEHSKSGASYVIPVVFHIIHNYGPENINDAQILDALNQLNIQFRKQNADTSEIVSSFKSIAADPEIEFRLAQLDPNGQCTKGITRTVSSLTAIGDHQVKSLIHWPPNQYLNIYVCAEAAGLAGHALLPAAADTVPQWDGIVMAHDYVGTIGTSDYFRRTVLSHEVGHYLNLQHIWGGNNVPNYYYLPCGDEGNCAFDDDVSDTPLTIGWSTCNLNGASCGTLDNVQNYMDYAYCARMFTEGQKQRMHACLNSTVANRNQLWAPSNLAATGTDNAASNLCEAGFVANKRILCIGDSVQLSDVSLHLTDSRSWYINGGNLSSTQDSIVYWIPDTPGKYDVQLQVSLGSTVLNKEEVAFLTVLPQTGLNTAWHESFEDSLQVIDHWFPVPNSTPVNWIRTDFTGYNSGASYIVENFDLGATSKFEFISEPFDASQLLEVALSFDYAYAQKQSTNIESLKVLYSTDCGENWTVKRNYPGSTILKTVDSLVTFYFMPEDSLDWKNDLIDNFNSSVLVNDLLFKFQFDAKGGNNMYIDNIRIGDPATLGINPFSSESFRLYPNPVNNELHIHSSKYISERFQLLDAYGKALFTDRFEGKEITIQTGKLAAGVYLIVFENGYTTKFIKN